MSVDASYDGSGAAGGEPTWASCLVLVVAYDDVAPAVEAAVRDVQRGLLLAPALSDFIELRFIGVGERPPPDGDFALVRERVVQELTSPERGAPENYFALVSVDDLASNAALLLHASEAPFDANGFDVRSAGFAVMGSRGGVGGDITVLGSRRNLGARLAEAIMTLCQGLMRQENDVRGVPLAALEAARPEAARETFAALSADVGTGFPPPSVPPPPPPPGDIATGPAAIASGDVVVVPVLTAVVGAVPREDRSRWRRVRSLVRDLDAQLSSESDPGAGIAFLLGTVDARGKAPAALRPAGSLRRGDVVRPESLPDFARHLTRIHAALDSWSEELTRNPRPATRPVVLLAALQPPLADAVSSEIYARLSERASIIWVLMGEFAGLLRETYGDRATVIVDHPGAVAEAYARILSSIAPAP